MMCQPASSLRTHLINETRLHIAVLRDDAAAAAGQGHVVEVGRAHARVSVLRARHQRATGDLSISHDGPTAQNCERRCVGRVRGRLLCSKLPTEDGRDSPRCPSPQRKRVGCPCPASAAESCAARSQCAAEGLRALSRIRAPGLREHAVVSFIGHVRSR